MLLWLIFFLFPVVWSPQLNDLLAENVRLMDLNNELMKQVEITYAHMMNYDQQAAALRKEIEVVRHENKDLEAAIQEQSNLGSELIGRVKAS